LLAAISIIISFCTRLLLLIVFHKQMDLSFSFVGSFFIGMLYDVIVSTFIIVPFVLQISLTNNFIYTKAGKVATILFFISALYVLYFTKLLPKDYSKPVYAGLQYYFVARFIVFLVLCFVPFKFRQQWRSGVLQFFFCFAIFLLFFNAISEVTFWQEFSCRYNFIAVDYLIYTNEVVGNIKESYPIGIILSSVIICTLAVWFFVKSSISTSVSVPLPFIKKLIWGLGLLLLPLLAIFFVLPQWKNFSKNNYANELAGNGLYQFAQAFQNNELDFYKFYQTLDDTTAFTILKQQLGSSNAAFTTDDVFNIQRKIIDTVPENKMNVVLISVESLSASFMKAFGNTQSITPRLDSLANKSLFFTNLYASGTRTVRGLEALALSIPPTPGQSIVKRAGNENMFSLGAVFKSKGYLTQFLYGGYSYFDNMNYFFTHNGYDVIDRSALSASEIHYANIWGVADEDLFTLSLKTFDANYKTGKPFFSQIMTVSNHRPFTYPDGRIDIPSTDQSREGGVKYTDYAIGDFISRAAKKPWFANTVFVIVADHCASSAGNQALPVTGYHIPTLIFSPANIAPAKVDKLTAQIDIAPTLLGLLHFNYTSKFFGQDVLNTGPEKLRAFISTYQGLGFIQNDKLVIQSPVKKVKTYLPDFTNGNVIDIANEDSLTRKAISFYQAAAWLIKNKKYAFEKDR